MSDPSDGRVAVEVIIMLNHCTELAIGTTVTGHKRGNDAHSLSTINFMMDCHSSTCRQPRLSESRLVRGWKNNNEALKALACDCGHGTEDRLQALIRCRSDVWLGPCLILTAETRLVVFSASSWLRWTVSLRRRKRALSF